MHLLTVREDMAQPPSGGCVLKRFRTYCYSIREIQPPSGGCVLKQNQYAVIVYREIQPPSGGCVLKLGYELKAMPDGTASRLRAAVC